MPIPFQLLPPKLVLPFFRCRLTRRAPAAVFTLVFIMLLGCNSSVYGQVDSIRAKQFAINPNLNAPDSIQIYTAYFLEKRDLLNWLNVHLNTGRGLLYQKNEKDQGIRSLEAALIPWRMPSIEQEWKLWALLHLNLGYIHHQFTRDFVRARTHYEISRAIYQDTLRQSDIFLAEQILTQLGNIHARFRDFEKAFYFLNQSKEICIRLKAYHKAAIAINGIGVKLSTKGEWQNAIQYYQEGLALPHLKLENIVQLSINLAQAIAETGQLDSAMRISLDCQRILEEKPDSFGTSLRLELWADLHDNLGVIAQQKKQWDVAAQHYRECRSFYTQKLEGSNNRTVAQCNLKLGDLFLECNRPDSALHYAQTALRCLLPEAPLEDDFSNPPLETLYSENTFSAAFRQKTQAFRNLSNRNPKDPKLLSLCLENCDLLFNTDEVLRREYDFEESKLYRQDVNRAYYEIAIWAAHRLQELTHDPALTERAFQYSELARERLLVEQMQDREKAALASEATKQQLANLRERRTRLQTAFFEKAIRGAANTSAADSLQALQYETHLAWNNLLKSIEKPKDENTVVQLPVTDLAVMHSLLPADHAMLEYFTGDSTIYVFVLSNQELHFLECPPLPNLNATVQALRKSLIDEEQRDLEEDFPLFSKSTALLYDVLLAKPLSVLSQSVNHLVVVQDGLLHNVPFELLGNAKEPSNFKTFPYLLRRYSLSYANSGSLLLRQSEATHRKEAPDLEPFIGFAPKYSAGDTLHDMASRARALQLRDGGYYDLPESRKEVKEIAEILQGKAYLSQDASEQQFKRQAPHCRILHLSMHAGLEESNPMFSKLLFTQNPQDISEDNDLHALELYDVQLNASLAVLSACETGLGKVRHGEGVMSLARAFAYAGVPATLMSLWKVEDGATRSLMVDFYRQLKTGSRKDDALKQAKLNYLKNCDPLRASPYFWGGFVASGNMEPLFGK